MDRGGPITAGQWGKMTNPVTRMVICMAAVVVVVGVLSAIHVQHDHLLSAALNLFLIVVLIAALRWGIRYAVLLSILSAIGFSWMLPPAGHFVFNDARVWALLIACLVTGVIAGQLTDRLRRAVTDANQRRVEAEAEQQRFTALVNSLEGIVWEADAETFGFTFVSDQAERILGYPTEKWVHEPMFWKEHVHPDDRERAVQFRVQATAEKRNHDFEYRMITADGAVVWIRDLITVAVENGRTTRLRGVMVDVTRRKQVELALRESERNLAEAQRLTHTGSFVWEVGTQKALYVSDEWYRIYGFDRERDQTAIAADANLEGMIPRVLFEDRAWEERLKRIHPEDRDKWQAAIDRAIRERSDYEFECPIVLPNGTVKYIHSIGHPAMDAAGNVVQFSGSVTDITERKRAEEEHEKLRQLETDLARMNRITTMGELTAALGHEVNQPIAAAVTNSNTAVRWLSGEAPDIVEAREAAVRAAKDATRAAEIINRIRSLFRKEATQRELVDINEVIDEIIMLLRNEAKRLGIVIMSDLADGLPQVLADRVQLQQVIMNLMMNSIDAMKDVDSTRELTLASSLEGSKQMLVSVRDTGVGLRPEMTRIFDTFFTTKSHGTGMGLPISRSIIESHGGRLWATANSGRGATFCFTLPTTS